MTGTVSYKLHRPLASITIDNPSKRNALHMQMWRALATAVDECVASIGVRVVVLRGSGSTAFSAGGDLEELDTVSQELRTSAEFIESVEAAFVAISGSPIPIVAMIAGHAIGGGLALACTCDLRVAADTLTAGIPATRLGVVPTRTELAAIQSLIGPSRTADLFLTGRLLKAEEAAAWGLVDRVVSLDSLESETTELAERIAEAAPGAVRQTLSMLRYARFATGERDGDLGVSARSLAGQELRVTLAAIRRGQIPVFEDV